MEQNKNAEVPSFVYRDGMTEDKEYVEWLSAVKSRFRQCQIKATIRVNTTMLEFYWSVGRDLGRGTLGSWCRKTVCPRYAAGFS